MSESVYEFKGMNGTLSIYPDHLVISREGFIAFSTQGVKGERTYFYRDISAIEYKRPSFVSNGYFKVNIAGSQSGATHVGLISSSKESMKDENTVLLRAFNKKVGDQTDEIYEYVNKQLAIYKQQAPLQSTAGVSSADEILKFKKLLDAGIITQEEFDQKKKELLGI